MARESDGDLVVPPTIHALLQARIDSLDRSSGSCSSARRSKARSFTAARSPISSPDGVRAGLDEQLAALVRKELIRPERSLMPGEDAYRFRHLLIREAAYERCRRGSERSSTRLRGVARAHGGRIAFELDEIVGYHLERALVLRQELGSERGAREADGARLLAAGTGPRAARSSRGGGPVPAGGRRRSADDRTQLERCSSLPGRSVPGRARACRLVPSRAAIELAEAVGDQGSWRGPARPQFASRVASAPT